MSVAPDKAELLKAVETLVGSHEAGVMLAAVRTVARLSVGFPVLLGGDAAAVNPLVRLMKYDPVAFERVLGLVDSKRAAAGMPPVAPPPEERFDKTEYMREFMDQKRQRQRRAATIENMCRPQKDALIGRARLDFMDASAAKWKAELDQRMAKAREAQGGRLPKETIDTIRAQFWAWVDDQLDDLEAAAVARIRGK